VDKLDSWVLDARSLLVGLGPEHRVAREGVRTLDFLRAKYTPTFATTTESTVSIPFMGITATCDVIDPALQPSGASREEVRPQPIALEAFVPIWDSPVDSTTAPNSAAPSLANSSNGGESSSGGSGGGGGAGNGNGANDTGPDFDRWPSVFEYWEPGMLNGRQDTEGWEMALEGLLKEVGAS
jgi:hypothetical protein